MNPVRSIQSHENSSRPYHVKDEETITREFLETIDQDDRRELGDRSFTLKPQKSYHNGYGWSLYLEGYGSPLRNKTLEAVYKLKSLVSLSLVNFRLRSIDLTSLDQLEELDLACNHLQALKITHLTRLEELDLMDNAFETVPDLTGLTKLRKIEIGMNKLKSIPDAIWKLPKLTNLSLMKTNLTALPPEIGQLQWLVYLDVSNNDLTSLPSEIGKLVHLRVLKFDYNPRLKEIPPSFSALTQLPFCSIKGTQITPEMLDSVLPMIKRVKDALLRSFTGKTSYADTQVALSKL